jgi:hypothetical protein
VVYWPHAWFWSRKRGFKSFPRNSRRSAGHLHVRVRRERRSIGDRVNRERISTALGCALTAYAAVFETAEPATRLIVGGMLVGGCLFWAGLMWRTRFVRSEEAIDAGDCRAATAGAVFAMALVLFAWRFEDLDFALQLASGVILAAGALAVAHLVWRSRRAVAGAALAVTVATYGVLFESIDGPAEAIVPIALAGVVVAAAALIWRDHGRVATAALVYALILYRLFFDQFNELGWKTLAAVTLFYAFVVVGLRWWMYWQVQRFRWAAGVITLLSMLLVVFTVLRGVDLLNTTEPPRERGEPPAVGFVPPTDVRPGRGFAVGMAIQVAACDEPVTVTIVVAGTAEYWSDHKEGGDFKLGIPGTDLHIRRSGLGYLDVDDPADAIPRPEEDWTPTHTVNGNMTVIEGHLPPLGRPFRGRDVVVTFDATRFDDRRSWLEERGQGSCFVRLPALTGDFTALATEQADGRARPADSFPKSWVKERAQECVPETSEREVDGQPLEALYCPEAEIVHGNVSVRMKKHEGSTGEILTDESLPDPDTVVEGDPVWSCRSDPRGEDRADAAFELHEARQGFPYSTQRLDRQIAPNCSGFVAVAEADADERRDLTLILIGIGVALGLGMFVEILMRWLLAEFPPRPRKP